jgi:dUTP pyrophosphatase
MEVKIQLVRKGSKLPKKAHEDDACYDVFISKIERPERRDGMYILKLGFKTEIPKGYKGVLVPRSSLTKECFYMPNTPGQIDPKYRGEWEMRLRPVSDFIGFPLFPFKVGDRCGQIYFEKVVETSFKKVDKLEDSERGEGGFGSTGK